VPAKDPADTESAVPKSALTAIDSAVEILDDHRIMAISTLRPDGWPQSTIVGYANDRLSLYFVIMKSSQKLANIQRDNRVSVAIGREPWVLWEAKAVYAGARAVELTDDAERNHAWQLLNRRHPNLAPYDTPNPEVTAMMRADCVHVSVVDFTKGAGHVEAFEIEPD
jgi:nitroimidazol reductase NimA-like FMN-containing flavoprotein (pyridoxamine 5'-phosphate oxidase superfamily)